jgi:hypothetical protein
VKKLKKIIIPAIALSILSLIGLAKVSSVSAEDSQNYPPIVQKLVARFNLDAGEVQKVFDEEREERQQEDQLRFEERLSQAVTNGVLTQEQKEAILAKRAEIQARHEEMKNLSWEEKRKAMEQEREEIKNWAEENGIEIFWFSGHHEGGRFGFGP